MRWAARAALLCGHADLCVHGERSTRGPLLGLMTSQTNSDRQILTGSPKCDRLWPGCWRAPWRTTRLPSPHSRHCGLLVRASVPGPGRLPLRGDAMLACTMMDVTCAPLCVQVRCKEVWANAGHSRLQRRTLFQRPRSSLGWVSPVLGWV